MKNIMFVDDEPHVLDSLRNLLRKQRKEWRMSFIPGGEAALQELLAVEYDVIVSDMRMPGMDGAALLTRVLDEYPHIVRIVLSGQTEQEITRRMVHVAHQFIAKPCEGATLQQTIRRACDLQAMLEHPGLRRAVGQIGQLPVKPQTYSKLVTLLSDPHSSIADAAQVVESDAGTSSKILQVVNSAFFGLPHRVTDMKSAVAYLGLEMVKMLALSVEMRQSQGALPPIPGFSLDAVEAQALLTAKLARRLMPDKVKSQDAFAAAVLKDTGLVVLASRMPDLLRKMLEEVRASGRSLFDVETEVLGITHAQVGAYLLGIWGLPYTIVEAVAHHHAPRAAGAQHWDVVGAVHVASGVISETLAGRGSITSTTLDLEHLKELGVADELPHWRALAHAEDVSLRA